MAHRCVLKQGFCICLPAEKCRRPETVIGLLTILVENPGEKNAPKAAGCSGVSIMKPIR